MRNRWLFSTILGASLVTASATAALAQNVPSENATAPTGPGAATQTIQLKPGQEAGTTTVLPADTAANPNASTADAHFVTQASAGGLAEVMFGQLAQQRGQTEAERNFGQMLVADHTKANGELSRIAETERLKTASAPTSMQQQVFEHLQNAPASQFDTMFNHAMIRAHERTIALFEGEARSGQNPSLRQFALTTLPTLTAHLRLAQQLSPMAAPRGGMASMAAPSGSPVTGNPDHSADQLNARELNAGNPS